MDAHRPLYVTWSWWKGLAVTLDTGPHSRGFQKLLLRCTGGWQEFLGEGTVSTGHPAVGDGRRMGTLLLTASKDVTLNCFRLKSLSDFKQASLETVEVIRKSWGYSARLSSDVTV